MTNSSSSANPSFSLQRFDKWSIYKGTIASSLLIQRKQSKFIPHFLLSPEIKAVVGSGNQAERKIDIMDNFLDLGRSLVPDNLFQVIMMMIRSEVL